MTYPDVAIANGTITRSVAAEPSPRVMDLRLHLFCNRRTDARTAARTRGLCSLVSSSLADLETLPHTAPANIRRVALADGLQRRRRRAKANGAIRTRTFLPALFGVP